VENFFVFGSIGTDIGYLFPVDSFNAEFNSIKTFITKTFIITLFINIFKLFPIIRVNVLRYFVYVIGVPE
jgi:hypothetical protein